MSNGEFYNRQAGGNGCSYSNLANYNLGGAGAMAPVPANAPSMQKIVVPSQLASYGGYGYSSLTHGQEGPSCGGYFGIGRAYPTGSACGSFVSRSCN